VLKLKYYFFVASDVGKCDMKFFYVCVGPQNFKSIVSINRGLQEEVQIVCDLVLWM